tara:strand:- start:3985 stop:5022 length:1038 start_codon:yes stop_codon:yes gene_type:complete
MKKIANKQLDPSLIIQIGMGFWASKTLLTAVNVGLFSHLANQELSGVDIQKKIGLHQRSLYDFLDALVALGFLKRTGIKETAMYSNSAETDFFLDNQKPTYVGGILEMSNNRLYPFWNDLEEALKTGLPQNETKNGGKPLFEEIYKNEDQLQEFVNAMAGIQMGNFITFSNAFDFSKYETLCDVGGAGAHLSAQVCLNNPHMVCTSFDLPEVSPIATENINRMGLKDRIYIKSGDFFKDDIPNADVITMGNILHDWGIKDKLLLIEKAFKALPKGGALVVIENIIDDERKQNVFSLLMSLNMLIETEEGFDFSGKDFAEWAKETGFQEITSIPLTGPTSAIIAIK